MHSAEDCTTDILANYAISTEDTLQRMMQVRNTVGEEKAQHIAISIAQTQDLKT